jgi:hypothetical protein
MDPREVARRNHAVQVLIHHGDACRCFMCERAAWILRRPARLSVTCIACTGAVDPNHAVHEGPVSFCQLCFRDRQSVIHDYCPACQQLEGPITLHHAGILACSLCTWRGPAALLVGLPSLPPPFRVYSGSFIPF